MLEIIQRGIESSRIGGKDAPSPYHEMTRPFRIWWEAACLKADCPDWSESRITQEVKRRVNG